MLPSISIVVPNYNGGKTIGGTLQSLIDQGYPDLQLIVVDGASKDDSVEVIKRYEQHIDWWGLGAGRGPDQRDQQGVRALHG